MNTSKAEKITRPICIDPKHRKKGKCPQGGIIFRRRYEARNRV